MNQNIHTASQELLEWIDSLREKAVDLSPAEQAALIAR